MNEVAKQLRLVAQAAPPEQSVVSNPLANLAAEGHADLREIVEILQSVCQSAYAAILIREDDSCHLAITAGLEPFRATASEGFCLYTMDCHYTFAVGDASVDERFRDSPYVAGDSLRIRSFASAPIYDGRQEMVGRLCVFDPGENQFDESRLRALGTLARNVSGIVALQQQRLAQGEGQSNALPVTPQQLRVAAAISHDMRMPLASLRLTLEMLDDLRAADQSASERHLIVAAQRSTRRLSSMVEGILELNQLEAGLQLDTVDLQRLTREVIAELGTVLSQAGASVQMQQLPRVVADEQSLFRVLLNLINNAVKFARPGVPPHLEISAVRRANAWEITVSDNGLGVPPAKRTEVFETFARLHPGKPGNGIGLPTVTQIVSAHGGNVGIRDVPSGSGAQFWFTLPDRVQP